MPQGTIVAPASGFAAEQARLAHDRTYQFDFAAAAPQPHAPDWLNWLLPAFKFIAPAAPYLFWGGLILGAGLVLVLVGRAVLRERREGRRAAKVLDGPALAPSRSHVRALLEEADRLAGEARFGEAARVLLHRTLEDLAARRPGLIAPSQTAREITALEALPPPAREPLAQIAAAVELFLFAGRSLNRAAFDSCRAEYDRFLSAVGSAGGRA